MAHPILKHPYWEPPICESEMATKIYERWTRAALKTYRYTHEMHYQAGRICKAEYEASLTCKVGDLSPEWASALREWFETTYWKPKSKKHVRFAENTEIFVIPSNPQGVSNDVQSQPTDTPEPRDICTQIPGGLCHWIYLNIIPLARDLFSRPVYMSVQLQVVYLISAALLMTDHSFGISQSHNRRTLIHFFLFIPPPAKNPKAPIHPPATKSDISNQSNQSNARLTTALLGQDFTYKSNSKLFYAGLVAVTAGVGAGLRPLVGYKLASLHWQGRNQRLGEILIVAGAVGSALGSMSMFLTSWKLAANLSVPATTKRERREKTGREMATVE